MAFFLLKPFICNLSLTAAKNTWEHPRVVAGVLRGFCVTRPSTQLEEMTINSHEPTVIPVFHAATHHLKRIALKDRNGTHTYQEILRKSLMLAGRIRQKLGPEKSQERIVFLCPNDVTYLLAQWACWASGHIGIFICFYECNNIIF